MMRIQIQGVKNSGVRNLTWITVSKNIYQDPNWKSCSISSYCEALLYQISQNVHLPRDLISFVNVRLFSHKSYQASWSYQVTKKGSTLAQYRLSPGFPQGWVCFCSICDIISIHSLSIPLIHEGQEEAGANPMLSLEKGQGYTTDKVPLNHRAEVIPSCGF